MDIDLWGWGHVNMSGLQTRFPVRGLQGGELDFGVRFTAPWHKSAECTLFRMRSTFARCGIRRTQPNQLEWDPTAWEQFFPRAPNCLF